MQKKPVRVLSGVCFTDHHCFTILTSVERSLCLLTLSEFSE